MTYQAKYKKRLETIQKLKDKVHNKLESLIKQKKLNPSIAHTYNSEIDFLTEIWNDLLDLEVWN